LLIALHFSNSSPPTIIYVPEKLWRVWISKARIICAIHPQIPSHGDFYRETRGALVAASRIDAYAELLFGRLAPGSQRLTSSCSACSESIAEKLTIGNPNIVGEFVDLRNTGRTSALYAFPSTSPSNK
jgi:hypothetical protein